MKKTVRLCFLFSAMLLAVRAIAAPDPQLETCLPTLQQRALDGGVTQATVDNVLSQVQYSPKVIELDRRQPEFSETFYNYLNNRVTEERVRIGRKMMAQYHDLLEKLMHQYGVPPQYLLAFWGMETNFGSYLGKMRVLDSLVTLACDERRSEFFTLELIQALKMVDENIVAPELFVGSWAGAVGNMQFMPSAYRAHAVDGDGDGRADLWRSIPDAMTSAANYLSSMGWKKELRWGREVVLPKKFDYSLASLSQKHPLGEWRALGVTQPDGTPLANLVLPSSILLPAGHTGPAFVVYDNFEIIMRWNRSEYYAISVGYLADRINGAGTLFQPPPNVARLTVDEVKQLQAALNAAGFDTGNPDGILGSGTRNAIRSYQKSKGLIADGYPSAELFASLDIKTP